MQQSLPKLLVTGYGEHGKDTVCEMLEIYYGFKFTSSSKFLADKVIFPALKDRFGYSTVDECYADRRNHRSEWYALITEYNKDDPTTLGRAIYNEMDIYCGLRNKRELHAMKNCGMYNVSIWVDAGDRIESETEASCTIEPWMCDFIIDNNGDHDDLSLEVTRLMNYILGRDIDTREMQGETTIGHRNDPMADFIIK